MAAGDPKKGKMRFKVFLSLFPTMVGLNLNSEDLSSSLRRINKKVPKIKSYKGEKVGTRERRMVTKAGLYIDLFDPTCICLRGQKLPKWTKKGGNAHLVKE